MAYFDSVKAGGTIGWLLALLVLIVCVIAFFFPAVKANPTELVLIGMLAASRLL